MALICRCCDSILCLPLNVSLSSIDCLTMTDWLIDWLTLLQRSPKPVYLLTYRLTPLTCLFISTNQHITQVIKNIALSEPLVDVVDHKNIISNHVAVLTVDVLTCRKEDLAFHSNFVLTCTKVCHTIPSDPSDHHLKPHTHDWIVSCRIFQSSFSVFQSSFSVFLYMSFWLLTNLFKLVLVTTTTISRRTIVMPLWHTLNVPSPKYTNPSYSPRRPKPNPPIGNKPCSIYHNHSQVENKYFKYNNLRVCLICDGSDSHHYPRTKHAAIRQPMTTYFEVI